MSESHKSVGFRRWFRFSLRTFLVFVTVVCVALGLYVKRERDRYLAIEAIKRWGGEVWFVGQPTLSPAQEIERTQLTMLALQEGKPRPEFPQDFSQGNHWLRGMFGRYGKYHGADVQGVYFSRSSFTPAGTTLDIGGLSAIPELESLLLGEVSSAGFSALPSLPRLEVLSITVLVNDASLDCLAGVPRLKELTLTKANLTSRGMAAIGSCSNLTKLNLDDSLLEDAGFAHFTALPLQELSLKESNASDAAVPFLVQLKGLKTLNVEYTNITLEGARRLQRKLPLCKIRHDYGWLE